MPNSQSLTLSSNVGILRVLATKVQVCAAYDPNATPPGQRPPWCSFDAIWDTGATGSVITQRVVDTCGLKPIGMTQVHHAHGMAMAETYLVNIGLPNRVGFANMTVTKGDLALTDALIGMDIITRGDFAITNKAGKTVMSFRVPSLVCVDYVEEHKQQEHRQRFQHGGSAGEHRKRPKEFGKKKKKRR